MNATQTLFGTTTNGNVIVKSRTYESKPLRTEIRMVNPEQAKMWLTMNTMNRRVDLQTVDYYADQMKRGQWTISQDAITFSDSHALLNGQHRLQAVIKSATEQPFIVVYNMEESSFVNMDLNKRRSPSDVFKIKNITSYVAVSAGINRYFTLKKGYITRGQNYDTYNKARTKTSIPDMLNFYSLYTDLISDVVSSSESFYGRFKYLRKTDYFSYMMFLILDRNHESSKVYDFFKQLSRGGSEIRNETINILRDKLIFNETSKTKMTPALRHFYIVKTWNAYITNKNLKVLKVFNSDDLSINIL
jgi:hypothetical protein